MSVSFGMATSLRRHNWVSLRVKRILSVAVLFNMGKPVLFESHSYVYEVIFSFYGSRDSSVGIATGYVLNGRGVGVRVTVGPRIFSSSRRPDRVLSLGIKRPGHDSDHSPPASAEVKKNGSIHPLPHKSSWRIDTILPLPYLYLL
jgi:hypothetical protein